MKRQNDSINAGCVENAQMRLFRYVAKMAAVEYEK